MDNSKFLKLVIIVLILLNVATLAFVWKERPAYPPFPPPPPMQQAGDPLAPYHFLVNALKLDDKQQQEYSVLRDEHHTAVDAIERHNRDFHKRLYDLLGNSSNDTIQALKLADSIANGQREIELITFRHFKKVRAICTPQQQAKFDSVINDALRMMAPQPPHPPKPGDARGNRPDMPPPPPGTGYPPPPPPPPQRHQ